MSRFIIAISMLIIAGIICGCELYMVNSSAQNFTDNLNTISQLMEEEKFEVAFEASKKTLDNWEKTSKNLDKYLYHDYIDNITEQMATLPVYAKIKDKNALDVQVAQIKKQLTSLKKSELPYIYNIL